MRKQALFATMIEVATSIIWGESASVKYVFLKAFFPCLAMSYLDSLETVLKNYILALKCIEPLYEKNKPFWPLHEDEVIAKLLQTT